MNERADKPLLSALEDIGRSILDYSIPPRVQVQKTCPTFAHQGNDDEVDPYRNRQPCVLLGLISDLSKCRNALKKKAY